MHTLGLNDSMVGMERPMPHTVWQIHTLRWPLGRHSFSPPPPSVKAALWPLLTNSMQTWLGYWYGQGGDFAYVSKVPNQWSLKETRGQGHEPLDTLHCWNWNRKLLECTATRRWICPNPRERDGTSSSVKLWMRREQRTQLCCAHWLQLPKPRENSWGAFSKPLCTCGSLRSIEN